MLTSGFTDLEKLTEIRSIACFLVKVQKKVAEVESIGKLLRMSLPRSWFLLKTHSSRKAPFCALRIKEWISTISFKVSMNIKNLLSTAYNFHRPLNEGDLLLWSTDLCHVLEETGWWYWIPQVRSSLEVLRSWCRKVEWGVLSASTGWRPSNFLSRVDIWRGSRDRLHHGSCGSPIYKRTEWPDHKNLSAPEHKSQKRRKNSWKLESSCLATNSKAWWKEGLFLT